MLRLNVVCTERDQRFMVLGKEEETLDQLRHQTQKIFSELYPDEAPLCVIGFQNEFHFDIPLQYRIGDALIDTGLVFAIEGDAIDKTTYIPDNDSGINVSSQEMIPDQEVEWEEKDSILSRNKRKFENNKKRLKMYKKKKLSSEARGSPSIVSSTCSPNSGSPLFPQRVESGDEDNEVDIESLHEEQTYTDELKKSPKQHHKSFSASTPYPQTPLSPTKKDKKTSKKKKKKNKTM